MTAMTTAQAARRLGVKVETLYAYVSRGIIASQPGDDGRVSVFDSRAVEELTRRGRPRQSSRSSSLNMLIETRLTSLSPQGVRYRGLLSSELARTQTFETVAELLWLGRLDSSQQPWRGDVLSPSDQPLDLSDALRVIAARATAITPKSSDRSAVAVAEAGRRLIATMVDSLPLAGDGRTPRLVLPSGGQPIRASIAGRLWTRLSARRPAPGALAVVNAALVLMADHELAASTLGVRVAASTHASPYAVVNTGLGVLSGALHGGASRMAREMLDVAAQVGAPRAVSTILNAGGRIPGFGHRVYVDADPRALVLLDLLRAAAGSSRAMSVAADVLDEVRKRIGREPNVDFALAALTSLGAMPADAGEVLMAVARTAGWLAHTIEEFTEAPLRFRPRASYIGR